MRRVKTLQLAACSFLLVAVVASFLVAQDAPPEPTFYADFSICCEVSRADEAKLRDAWTAFGKLAKDKGLYPRSASFISWSDWLATQSPEMAKRLHARTDITKMSNGSFSSSTKLSAAEVVALHVELTKIITAPYVLPGSNNCAIKLRTDLPKGAFK